MCPYQYYQIMRNSKDKKQIRYQMVQHVLAHGIKPTARIYHTSPPIVRKWVRRFNAEGYSGLEDRSKRPHHSPNETPSYLKEHVVMLKHKYKRIGADQIKPIENVPLSTKTMRKIWRDAGISSRKRRKKHVTKNNLREVKKHYQLFEQMCEDTKDLCDIPEYWIQMKLLNLPKWQYTFREVSCGPLFLGFANERSLTHAYLFAIYINHFLKKFDVLPKRSRRQTDNGNEYVGAWNAIEPSAYTRAIHSLPGQEHHTIPPRAHTWQSDVETIHNLMEMEFYEIESFRSRQDFINKASAYQLFFNLKRPNSYKEHQTPWQLAQEKNPNLDKRLLMIPAVDLDKLLAWKLQLKGGNDVLTVPFSIFTHSYKSIISVMQIPQKIIVRLISVTNLIRQGQLA